MSTEEEQAERVKFLQESLPGWHGKRVKVTVEVPNLVDVEPGQPPRGFQLVDYCGIIQNPAIDYYPPENQNGKLCLYLQSWDALKQVFAIELGWIVEVDDDIPDPTNKHVNMTALQ